MKIAIVGTGISGLVTGWALHDHHEVTLFEAQSYIGGHTHTIDVKRDSGDYAVDTGFIVFNETTYPNFCKILEQLGVASQPTSMSFAVRSLADDLEYNGDSLATFFAQPRNLFKPTIYRLLWDMVRFNRQLGEVVAGVEDDRSLVSFLEAEGYSRDFLHYFILPMTSALWSAPPEEAKSFPIALFARFFRNHGILNLRNRLQWRVITGGSARYVERLVAPFRHRIRLDCPVQRVRRLGDHVEVRSAAGVERFDEVIFAVHSDQALQILEDPSPAEREILGAIRYQRNDVLLHTDSRVMPRDRRLWASWNYLVGAGDGENSTVTYDMNILQSISAPETFLVSLNQKDLIDPELVIGSFEYMHPAYGPGVVAAQKRHGEISGVNRTHYCGAYWGYGFHEDGVRSGLAVCRSFGRRPL